MPGCAARQRGRRLPVLEDARRGAARRGATTRWPRGGSARGSRAAGRRPRFLDGTDFGPGRGGAPCGAAHPPVTGGKALSLARIRARGARVAGPARRPAVNAKVAESATEAGGDPRGRPPEDA